MIALVLATQLAAPSSQSTSPPDVWPDRTPTSAALATPVSDAAWVELEPDRAPFLWMKLGNGTSRVYRAEPGGGLADVTSEVGLDPEQVLEAAAWGDADGDGWPDLLALSKGGSASLWTNSMGVLTPVGHELRRGGSARFSSVEWVDVDDDGRDEMWLFGDEPQLLRFDDAGGIELVPFPRPWALSSTGTAGGADAPFDPAEPPASNGPGAAPHPESRGTRAAGTSRGGVETDGQDTASSGSGDVGTVPSLGVLTPTTTTTSPVAALCLDAVADQASAACLLASSVPGLGMLYPLSIDFNLDSAGRVGMGTTAPSEARLHIVEDPLTGDAVHAETAVGGASAVTAISSSASDGFGLKAEANSSVGRAVRAVNESSGGNAIGVEGVSRSNTGRGVVGIATNTSGPNFGVYGESLSTAGTGVIGTSATSGGTGVEGASTSVSDGVGVRAEANSSVGRAVRAVNEATAGNAIGVEGVSRSDTGRAVFGSATASSGTAAGVWGEATSDTGTGVVGKTGSIAGDHVQASRTGVFAATDVLGGSAIRAIGAGGASTAIQGVYDSTGVAFGNTITDKTGVVGVSRDAGGRGVSGIAQGLIGASGNGVGTVGISYQSEGTGVAGIAGGNILDNTPFREEAGVFGSSAGTLRAGVVGLGQGADGLGVHGVYDPTGTGTAFVSPHSGVSGSTSQPEAIGVSGFSQATTGQGIGVFGNSDADQGTGVAGQGALFGMSGFSNSGVGVYGEGGTIVGAEGVGVHGTVGLDLTVFGSGTSGSSNVAPGVTGWTEAPSDQPAVLGVHDDGDQIYSWLQPTGVCGTADVVDAAGVAGWNLAGGPNGCGVAGAVGPNPDFSQYGPSGVFGTTGVIDSHAVTGWNRAGGAKSAGVLGLMGSDATQLVSLSTGVVGSAGDGANASIGVGGYTLDALGLGVLGVSYDLSSMGDFAFQPGSGVTGATTYANASGVVGFAALSAPGASASGVMGRVNTPSSGNGAGVRGEHAGSGDGVRGTSESSFGVGVRGVAGTQGFGVVGECGTNGVGVYGDASAGGLWGMFADGDIGATGMKPFLHPHSSDPSKEICYVALEGNEVGTYFRGTTRLVGGRATIAVPEDFRLVTGEGGLSVQLTPRGQLALLCVISESLEEIVVAGQPDVVFHYFVQGVRRGYAGHEPIRANTSFVPKERGVPFGAHYPDEVRQALVSSGVLHPDFTPNETTAAELGWELRDPLGEGEDTSPTLVAVEPNKAHALPIPPADRAREGSAQRGSAGGRPQVRIETAGSPPR